MAFGALINFFKAISHHRWSRSHLTVSRWRQPTPPTAIQSTVLLADGQNLRGSTGCFRHQSLRPEASPTSLSQALDVEHSGRLRVVLVSHGDSWGVDRDLVDVVCSKYSLDPRFLAKHLDYPKIRCESNRPRDLRNAVESVNEHYYLSAGYTWNLGGEVFSQLSTTLGSCFSFAYEKECLSIAVHEEDHKVTLLLFLRAPQGSLVERSRIFFHQPDAQVTRSPFLESQPPNALSSAFVRTLSQTDFSATQLKERVIAKVVLPYIANLTGCCYATYHRTIAPRALKSADSYPVNIKILFDEVMQLITLQRQIKLFLLKFDRGGIESNLQVPIHWQLDGLIDDVKDIMSFHRGKEASSGTKHLGEMIKSQVDEAKEAKQTSIKLGRLSQLAYIFLPLQVTVSALGMNLKVFDTGNIELRSFFLILIALAIISFVPIISPIIPRKRISSIWRISRHSRRLAFLCGWFCLCHRSTTNDKLFDCGISHALHLITESSQEELYLRILRDRGTKFISTLQSQPFIFFPLYWKNVVKEILDIIDKQDRERD